MILKQEEKADIYGDKYVRFFDATPQDKVKCSLCGDEELEEGWQRVLEFADPDGKAPKIRICDDCEHMIGLRSQT